MNLLILGANADTAFALAKKFAQADKANLFLASRDLEMLAKKARDLELRYQVKAEPLFFDATDFASHPGFYAALDPKPDGVILAFGYLGDQEEGQGHFPEAKKIMDTNLMGAVSILEVMAADFEGRGHGFIIAFSSPAGDRGRQKNYLYGAAKGGLTIYLSGLRSRLHRRRVQVLTVIPGFIRTKMIEHLDLPARLPADPERVAADIYRAFRGGKDIVYTPWIWRWIMLAIKAIPEKLFKRMKM